MCMYPNIGKLLTEESVKKEALIQCMAIDAWWWIWKAWVMNLEDLAEEYALGTDNL